MVTLLNKKHSKESLLINAIWRSFQSGENIISLNQLFLRKLTPTESMSRQCVVLLLRSGLIKVSDRCDEPGIFMGFRGGRSCITAVRSPDVKFDLTEISKSWRSFDADSEVLLDLVFDLLSSTVVEYVKYFSARENLTVSDLNYNIPALRFFFENLSLAQTFMLFWRAIKNSAEEQCSVGFETIIDRAYQYFEHYCNTGKEIKTYPRPGVLGRSQLEKIIYFDVLKIESDPDYLPNIYEYFYSRHQIAIA